tara:strand:+ start:434 stop:946 length:513 start_codon:yes stop_codon:yes gene_type:complete
VVQALTNIIEEYLSVNLHDPTRKQENVTGRMIYYKILREHKYGYQAIARTLGKNHATVIHAINTFNDLYPLDREMRKAYEVIKELFYETNGTTPLQMTTRSELIDKVINLEKRNNSLFLSNEELKDSLKNYQRYDDIIQLIKERVVTPDTREYVYKKLNHILNGIRPKGH